MAKKGGKNSVDMKAVMREISKDKKVREQISKKVEQRVQEIKQKLIRDFASHPVTQEINAGVSAGNTSNLLGGAGNLFSFIGFSAGASPVDAVMSLLERNINFKRLKPTLRRVSKRDFKIEAEIEWVTMGELFSSSPMPWEPGSWLEGIERGISGLGQFMEARSKGRSKGGIQVKGTVNQGLFRPTKYLPAMLLEAEQIMKKGK